MRRSPARARGQGQRFGQFMGHKPAVALVAAAWVGLSAPAALAATVAYWNYDQGTNGVPFSSVPVTDLSGNGNTMYGFDSYWGPSYSSDTPTGFGLSQRSADNHQDGYTFGDPVNTWSPTNWTIEVTVKLDEQAGWETVIGRDGTAIGGPKSDFYFQNNGINDRWRLDFKTRDGMNYILDSDFVGETNKWYSFAMVSDGTTVTMWVNKYDGNGFQISASLSMTGTDRGLANANGANWTFGRGWYNGGFVDHISGNLDEVRFSDVALDSSQFIVVPEPGTLALALLGIVPVVWRGRRAR